MERENKSRSNYSVEEEKKINYEKEEFEKLLRQKEGYFKNHLDKYLDYYNLSKDEMKHFGESGRYNIPFLTTPLIKIMLENITENPFKDGRLVKVEDRKMKKERQKEYNEEQKKNEKNMYLLDGKGINLDKIIKYNKLIMEQIEELPLDVKIKLKKSTTYEFNYMLNEVIPPFLDRLTVLLSLLISESSVSAGNFYIEIINSLDTWIRNIALHSIDIEECNNSYKSSQINQSSDACIDSIFINVGEDGKLNNEINKSYIIDSILRDEYYRNIELTKQLNVWIKKEGLSDFLKKVDYRGENEKIDKGKIERYKVLEYIGYSKGEDYKCMNKELNLLEEPLRHLKNKVELLDEVKNGKMYKVNFYKDIMRSIVTKAARYREIDRNLVVRDAKEFIEPRELSDIFYKYLKKVLMLQSYKECITTKIIFMDNGFDKYIKSDFDNDLERYAIKIWEDYDCNDRDREKKAEEYIRSYYDKLKSKDTTEAMVIREYLSKAIEQMIIPKLIDEINNLV